MIFIRPNNANSPKILPHQKQKKATRGGQQGGNLNSVTWWFCLIYGRHHGLMVVVVEQFCDSTTGFFHWNSPRESSSSLKIFRFFFATPYIAAGSLAVDVFCSSVGFCTIILLQKNNVAKIIFCGRGGGGGADGRSGRPRSGDPGRCAWAAGRGGHRRR